MINKNNKINKTCTYRNGCQLVLPSSLIIIPIIVAVVSILSLKAPSTTRN